MASNPMSETTVDYFQVVSEHEVIFTINLTNNPDLRDPSVVQRSMNMLMREHANVDMWSAWTVQANGEWYLRIKVAGTINQDIISKYI